MWLRAKKAKGGSLDITPLVDLVFLLIIFFLLSTTFNVTPGIKLDLPEASSQKIHKDKKEIILSVDQSGLVYVNKDLVDPSSLLSRLSACAHEDRDTAVLIKGDRNARYGQMVDVLGTVKQSGLHRIAIMTQSKKNQSDGKDQAGEK
jgi:biopolymer transport protein ExbD/biopolymer transport protein TolR